MAQGKLTAKQREVLDYIKQCTAQRGYPPAVREICQAVGLKSTSSVHSHLESLERAGYIRRDPTKPRAIEICEPDDLPFRPQNFIPVPIVGTVTAGEPILAVENIEGYFPMLPENLPHEDVFMLKVRGESMINAGIFSGDYVIVEQTPSAQNGDMVVAMVDDSATVKTFYKEKDHIRLQPENDTMDPILVPDVTILGKVVGLYRNYR
ncbi:MAG: transcriptional repressor LexA [Lachnospiraceae bacterium]|nr:transcriptional repressor LexA [Lachnospiraceae bacterium]MBR0152612.1 transcriptional repressor LexA [Lachnospiraceae bacterium]